MFAKLKLLQDLANIASAVGDLISSNLDLLSQFEDVVLEAVAVIKNRDVTGAMQFVADAKALWVAAAARYDGSHAAIEQLVAAFKQLVADAKN